MDEPKGRISKRRLKAEQKVEADRYKILVCFTDENGLPDRERMSLRDKGA
ncbi:MAG: hypothetical protein IJ856_02705 [Candidatus Methanomethylophilaceae archaeon]|nr:hypothetical protein [Candidatus Methanomethylophilaceae archaeon]